MGSSGGKFGGGGIWWESLVRRCGVRCVCAAGGRVCDDNFVYVPIL